MIETHSELLCETARKSIQRVFDDRSVSVETAIMNLNDLRDHIDILIEALECDARLKEGAL